jgi:hypothetical protein
MTIKINVANQEKNTQNQKKKIDRIKIRAGILRKL